jgi:hypothetical protein
MCRDSRVYLHFHVRSSVRYSSNGDQRAISAINVDEKCRIRNSGVDAAAYFVNAARKEKEKGNKM